MVRGMANANVRLWLMLAALPAILSIGGGSTTVTLAQDVKPDFVDISQYFDGITEDRTNVTWAHAVNSRQALAEALSGSIMMLEADISIGKVNKTGEDIPIMAHPPSTESDLSLKDFLKAVSDATADGKKKKGVKLDFKTDEAFNASKKIIQDAQKQMTKPFPLWLNADILTGPVNADKANVTADWFLKEARITFPSAGLSVGWTTKVSQADNSSCYTNEHLYAMVAQLKKAGLDNASNVTLAVRAVFASRCGQDLFSFLEADLKNATITLWHGDNDTVAIKPVQELIKKVTRRRVYVDLPEPLRTDVLNVTTPSSSSRISSIASLIVLPFTVALCRLQ